MRASLPSASAPQKVDARGYEAPDAPRVNEYQASHDTDSARADAIAPNAATDRSAQNGAI